MTNRTVLIENLYWELKGDNRYAERRKIAKGYLQTLRNDTPGIGKEELEGRILLAWDTDKIPPSVLRRLESLLHDIYGVEG